MTAYCTARRGSRHRRQSGFPTARNSSWKIQNKKVLCRLGKLGFYQVTVNVAIEQCQIARSNRISS